MPHRIKPGQLDRIPFAASQIENVDKALLNFIEKQLCCKLAKVKNIKRINTNT